jgi:exodeoxyribonuclease V alpha subunit
MFTGLAKQAFHETYQHSPWKTSQKLSSVHNWPLLKCFLSQNRISYLDYLLVSKLLADYSEIEESAACLICHLVLAAKRGHLCIQIDYNRIIPSPRDLWQQEESLPLSIKEENLLIELILKGTKTIPEALIAEVNDYSTQNFPFTPLCRYKHLIYLQRHWVFESLFIHHFNRLKSVHPILQVNEEKIKNSASLLCEKGVLFKEQCEAVLNGCFHPVSLITGGPGTGKTYTASYFIRIFWESLSIEERKKCKILLAAPTGKAAANLQKSLGKVMSELDGFPSGSAKTLHALLKGSPRLFGDIILVDESSMIDIKMMASLLESIVNGSRLVLLGDPYQLPSVEAGSVFYDLIRIQSISHSQIPCSHLKICLRAEVKSIIEFAQIVKEGKADEAIQILQQQSQLGICYEPIPIQKKEIHSFLLNQFKPLFPSYVPKEMPFHELLKLFNQVRLLSPMRNGLLGVDFVNELLWQHFNAISETEGWIAFPIMIVINDYRQDLFNGETGVLMRKLPLKSMGSSSLSIQDYALFPCREGKEESIRKIPAILLPKYEYAYCLSVHKSQGSEFDQVILIMPEGSEVFGREVFYTAITRAKKQLRIYGSESVIHQTILKEGSRLSGFKERFLNHF